jgi:hypothetical protein
MYISTARGLDAPVEQPLDKVTAPAAGGLLAAGDKVQVSWNSSWYKARILKREGDRYFINYEGWGSNWDEWVTLERMRAYDGSPLKGITALPMPNQATTPRPAATPEQTKVPEQQPAAVTAKLGADVILDWIYIETQMRPKNFGGNRFIYYRFFPDGSVAREAAVINTTDAKAIAASRQAAPALWGQYSIGEERVRIEWGNGALRELKRVDKPNGMALPPLVRAGKFPAGHKLDGKYVNIHHIDLQGQTGGTVSSVVRFSADGSFETDKTIVVTVGDKDSVNKQYSDTSPEVKGSYSIDGWNLKSNVKGFETAVIFAFSMDDINASPPVLNIGGGTWKLDKKD